MTEKRRALEVRAELRGKGHPSEVYWSETGYFLVTLDHLPAAEARRKRDEAVRAGDIPGDAYLIAGTSLREKINP